MIGKLTFYEKIIEDVQKIIQCAKIISEVDTSADKFISLSDFEKESGHILGMISPIPHELQCRKESDDKSIHAPQWVIHFYILALFIECD